MQRGARREEENGDLRNVGRGIRRTNRTRLTHGIILIVNLNDRGRNGGRRLGGRDGGRIYVPESGFRSSVDVG